MPTTTHRPAPDAPPGFDERYRAISARDRRFDGQFITAVRTTGIYCRPSCPARTPKPENVTFYRTSAAAHEAGYRACKRCLPEAVPGTPAWSTTHDLAARAMRLIGDGTVDRDGVPGLARRLGYSERQLTRVLTAELGAGPLALARAVRAQTARTLVVSTDLGLADVAFAAGFGSIRQFNDTITEVFGMTPTALRATRRRGTGPVATASAVHANATRTSADSPDRVPAAGPALVVDLTLPVRLPFDAAGVLGFLAARSVAGVERSTEVPGTARYARTLDLPQGPGAFEATWTADERFAVRLRLASLADLPAAIARVRRLFDLDADPLAVDAVLGADPVLAASVAATPGIRLPGAVDGHEILFRAMIGQQISVAAARTHLGRLAALGTPVDLGADGLDRMFPTAVQIAERGHEALTGPRARVEAILAVARTLADGGIDLSPAADPTELRAALLAQKGIGPWTADYVAMRVLGDPDVLLTTDLALRAGARNLGLPDPLPATTGETWAPWRSYASMHLWRAAAGPALPIRTDDPADPADPKDAR